MVISNSSAELDMGSTHDEVQGALLFRSIGGYSQQSGSTTFRSASSTSPRKQPPSPAAARAASQALSDVSLAASTIQPSSPVTDAQHATASLSWAAESEVCACMCICRCLQHASLEDSPSTVGPKAFPHGPMGFCSTTEFCRMFCGAQVQADLWHV